MIPTLKKGDRAIIERFNNEASKDLKRFDLVAIIPPFVEGKTYQGNSDLETQIGNLVGLPGLKQDPIYIRRVIALPGESIQLRQGVGVFVDGKLLEEQSFTTERPKTDVLTLKDIVITLPSGKKINPYGESQEPLLVPENQYLLMPDNRNNFAGSDQWGFISKDRIVGRLSHRYGMDYLNAIASPKVVFANQKVELNDQGVKALENQEFAKAIKLFNQALKIDPKYQMAKDNLSIAYNNYAINLHKKSEAAIDKLHKALYISPDNELTRKNLNKILERLGKDPDDGKLRREMADKAFKENRLLDALVEFREAQRLNPTEETSAKIEQLQDQKLFPQERFATAKAK